MNKKKLRPKQRKFVLHYLITLNQTKAAIAAGYSEKSAHVQGSRMLDNAKVLEEINIELDKALGEQRNIFKHQTIRQLKAIAFANADDLDGNQISGKTTTKHRDGSVTERIKLFDKNPALNMALKYLGLLNDDNDEGIDRLEIVFRRDEGKGKKK